jgi:hydrophobic/amphiphilic exporter-1 (mainly G- bacteria), HAE1 family
MEGGIIGWAIRRPVSTAVGVILVLIFGFLSVSGIPIQLTPDVTVPTVTVTTTWPGASPVEIETEILEEQEEALKSLPGLQRMTSEAVRNRGTVTLELEVGVNLEEALVRVTNLLSQVPDYPASARQPVVNTASSAGPPLAVLVIQSSPRGRDVAEYGTWVEEDIVPRFERIPGVSGTRVIGGRPQEIHIDFDPGQLAARRLTVGHVATAVRSELADVSAGDIPQGKRRYAVRTQIIPDGPEDLEGTVLATSADGTPTLLGQVATVTGGLRKPEAFGLIDGSPSMALLLYQEAGSNVLEVTQQIHRLTAELQRQLLAPEGLEMRVVADQIDYITGALDLVRDNLLLGGALAVVVLFLFLRSVGASVIVAVSIPVSIVGTVLGMSVMGRTINIVSLAGMAFAVGMVVDNSIVVLENIDNWRGREANIGRAALRGAREVWGAILASTATTAAVFIPIITWQDEVGELLRDIAVAVSTAVFVSLLVSVLVIPSFSARLLRSRKATGVTPDSGESLGRAGRGAYWIASSWLRSLVVAVGAAARALLIAFGLLPPMEYLPTGNRNIIFGVVVPPPGYSVDEMRAIGNDIQGQLVPHLKVDKDGVPAIDRTFFAGGPDQAFMGAVAVDPQRIADLAGFLRSVLQSVPDIIGFANQGSLFGRNLGGGRSIEIDISGGHLTALTGLGGKLFGALRAALPGAQIRPIPSLDPGAPELQVRPDRAAATTYGVSSNELGLVVDAYVDGAIIGELAQAGQTKRDVVLRAAGVDISSPELLKSAPVATPRGHVVPVGRIASVTETIGPTVIQRIERRRAITLQVAPPDELPFESALATTRAVVAQLEAAGEVDEGTRISYSGSAGRLAESKRRFQFVIGLAVVISFLLLAALFEDFLAPLAILITVPLAGAGGVIGLRLVDVLLGPQPLDMITAMGFVILIGVVVNNAILIVDGALARMRERDLPLDQAVASAVRWRVRPIFMSALTSLAGLLPLVLFPGAGSELYRGVGGVVLGGLALSTVLSLFVVPAVFSSLWRLRAAVARACRVGAANRD